MSNYKYSTYTYRKDLDSISIPKFQRSLVWTKSKKNDLILTLHKDYPFGALLVAPADKKGEYKILDGQQRLSTIHDYDNNKAVYWKNVNMDKYNHELDKINTLLKEYKTSITSSDFDKYLNDDYELADWTDQYDKINKDVKSKLRKIVKDCRISIKKYIDLDSLKVPVIEFLGDKSDLPEVFENLNKGGVPLTKYEVLSATWNEEILQMPQGDKYSNEILDIVKKYYESVTDNGEFEIDDFSKDEITEKREINLAEFGRALGSFVVERIPSLVSKTDKTFNELGFGILGIITGTPNKNIADIYKNKSSLEKDMTSNLERVDIIATKLNDAFKKILEQKISHTKKSSPYSTGLSTSFKILSYFAALWKLSGLDVNKSIRNIPAYYVADSLNGVWTAHGDQRLQDYYPNVASKNYLTPIEEGKFFNSFEDWISNNLGMRKTFSRETKALITIHSNLTYFADSLSTGEDFEFEHIIPKARILAVDKQVQSVYMSNIGNGMFLPKRLNAKKQSKTLYEYLDKKKDDEKKGIYEKYIKYSEYPEKAKLEECLNNLNGKKFDKVNEVIKDRSLSVAKDIIAKLLKNSNY